MSEVDKSITYQSDKTNNLPEIDIKFYIEKLEQTDPSLSDIDYNLIHAARFQSIATIFIPKNLLVVPSRYCFVLLVMKALMNQQVVHFLI